MKRSDVTVEALKALGYVAKVAYQSWHESDTQPCKPQQAAELFEQVVKASRSGDKIDIRRDYVNREVNVLLPGAEHHYRGVDILYYLSRPMTAAEEKALSNLTGVQIKRA